MARVVGREHTHSQVRRGKILNGEPRLARADNNNRNDGDERDRYRNESEGSMKIRCATVNT